jgi:hypothetical protein
VWGEVRLTAGVQFEFKPENLTRRHPERSRSSGAAKDLACSAAAVLTKLHQHPFDGSFDPSFLAPVVWKSGTQHSALRVQLKKRESKAVSN